MKDRPCCNVKGTCAKHAPANRSEPVAFGAQQVQHSFRGYNDHHYHFAYYVVSAAILVKLKPEYATNEPFVSFVETLMLDPC